MKHLKSYPLLENNNYDDILSYVEHSLLELNDTGFECRVIDERQENLEKLAPRGYKLMRTHDIINIRLYKKRSFTYNDVKDVYEVLDSFLTSNGYTREPLFNPSSPKKYFKDIFGDDNNKLIVATSLVYLKPLPNPVEIHN